MRKAVFICHPLRGTGKSGELFRNKEILRKICRYYIKKRNYLPLATALYFAEFLNDSAIKERKLGIKGGHELMKLCKEVHVFRMRGISQGMKEDIAFAKKNRIKIRYFNKYPWQFRRK